MNYQSYPNKKTTRSRRQRKAARNAAFRHNKSLRALADRAKRAERKLNNN